MKWPHRFCGIAATRLADRRSLPAGAVAVCLFVATVAGFPRAIPCAAEDAAAARPVAPSAARVLPAVPLPQQPPAAGPSSVATGRNASNWKVVGIITAAFAAVVAVRLLGRRRGAVLPTDVFEVLGDGSLGGQHAVRIVRFGPKTLLVSVSATGCQTLSELDDPQATECIAAACRGLHPPLRPVGGLRGAAGPSLPVPVPSRPSAVRVAGQEVA